MPEYEMFFRLFAEKVLGATLRDGERLRDAGDFKQRLLEAAVTAGQSQNMKEFFARLRSTS